jgi:ABC-type phosphate transport system, periplasmic component
MFASASAAALAVGFASQASAQNVFGGGATLPSQSNRELFNCFGADIRTAANPFFPAGCTAPVNHPARFFYAPTGSGGGLRAFALHDISAMGTPGGSNTVPYADNGAPTPSPLIGQNFAYPTIHFSNSESPLTPLGYPHPNLPGVVINNAPNQTLNCYYGVSQATGGLCTVDQRLIGGRPMVMPILSTTVGMVANFGGVSKTINLSRTSLCGIINGAITDWNNAQITADNGGVSVSGGVPRAIQVVVRADSSGTSFLFAQSLEAMCTPSLTSSAIYPAGFDYTSGVNTQPSWPLQHWRAQGNNGVAATVADTPWSVGYLSPDFHRPQVTITQAFGPVPVRDGNGVLIKTVAPTATTTSPANFPAYQAAAIQNISNYFRAPTAHGANRAMLDAAPPPAGAARYNPVNWYNGALPINPTHIDAYPASGFSWFLSYTCYNNSGSNAGVADAIRAYLSWYLRGTGNAAEILYANGFGIMPQPMMAASRDQMLGTADSRISIAGPGAINPNCTSVPGA